MKRHAEILLLSLGLLGQLCAAPAMAEKADRDKPINVEANSVKVDDIKKLAVYEGKVVLTQGTLMLTAERIEVTQSDKGDISGVALGSPVHFRQKLDGSSEFAEGWAERIEYDARSGKLNLLGQAHLKRGIDELRGNQISYDSNTAFFQAKGGGSGAASRVRAVIRPRVIEPSPPAPAASEKP